MAIPRAAQWQTVKLPKYLRFQQRFHPPARLGKHHATCWGQLWEVIAGSPGLFRYFRPQRLNRVDFRHQIHRALIRSQQKHPTLTGCEKPVLEFYASHLR